jgi:uncharacterized protein YcbX
MPVIGRVESLWRYPVKSMRGEPLDEAFVGFAGIYGDRLYAIRSAAAAAAFPFLTAREQERMLRFQPRFRRPQAMLRPPNLNEAEALGPGVTPVYAPPADTGVDVETPGGEKYPIDDPRLLDALAEGLGHRHALTLIRSDRAFTDCRPVSIFGTWTARRLGEELGAAIDQRRFRANIYADLDSRKGFAEDDLVGRTLKIGRKAVVAVLERDPRCKMITLDPDSSRPNPDIIRWLTREHEGKAGVYAAVLVEGSIYPGDEIAVAE